MTKAERREAARRERQELIRKAAIRRKRRRVALVLGVIVLVAGVAVGVVLAATGSNGPTSKTALPGLQTSTLSPGQTWQPEYSHLPDRLNTLGLPSAPSMTATFHHHDLLQIYIHGQPVSVPSQIGIDNNAGYLTSIHTHDASGIVHLESPTPHPYTLGEVFDVWGVRFTRSCIGGYCSKGGDQLRVYVNGNAIGGDPATIKLGQHMDVVVTFGTTKELPNPIPKTYSKNLSSTCAGSC